MNAAQPQGLPCIYVHLTSGLVKECCPADSVHVEADTVDVLNAGQQVARFTARDVFFCSHLDVAPFPSS
ncbi:MAG: hypothetical protein AB7P33_09540 [Dehalococcoidia bacterium]